MTQDGENRPALPEAPWLQRHKVELPDPIDGYVQRPELEQRCTLLDHRLTVLHAPGGFGKTALLAHCCRALEERGIAVAWLSLDEEDGPGSLAMYLALAFERAGLETFDPTGARDEGARTLESDTEADSQADYRLNLLTRALERYGAPCVLALDEVERLRSPEAVATINALLRRAPRHLHVGMAFRERPPGLAIAMFALEGRVETLTTEELRFSTSDISRFFDTRLSRRELASVTANSAGWPIALRIYRNARRHGSANAVDRDDDDTVSGWIETRLWRDIATGDREFLLDIALFDRIEPDLIEEVTGVRNTERRMASMGTLAGLLSTTGGGGSTLRLHPLIKDHCEKQLSTEDPERYRAIRRGIAIALARHARFVEALRHAAEADDTELQGQIAERTGGVKLWLEQGLEVLRTVDGLLGADVLAAHPRMALVRCVILTTSGDIDGARRVYRETATATAGFTRDREGGDNRALQVDHIIVRDLLHMCGCDLYGGWIAEGMQEAHWVADEADTDPLLRGIFSLGICITHNLTSEFDLAVEWAQRTRLVLAHSSPYRAYIDFQLGSIAMAQGRTGEAEACYDRALKIARVSHLRDSGAVMIGDVLAAELELERSTGIPHLDGVRVSPRLLGECSAFLDVYTVNAAVGAELALLHGGQQAALALVEDALDYAHRTERPALARFGSALRVWILLAGEEVEQAGRAWRFARLPGQPAECIDLNTQSWREAELLACVRLRLFIACGEFDSAREFAGLLKEVATQRGLVRMSMRSLVLSMVLECRAGRRDRARAHLIEYLRLFAETDYARPLSRDREIALALLDEVADSHRCGDAAVSRAAAELRQTMLDDASSEESPAQQLLSKRELDVLTRLERHRDKEIAKTLNLSYDGVRYHIRNLFAKLGARGRLDAVYRARAQGILPPTENTSESDIIRPGL